MRGTELITLACTKAGSTMCTFCALERASTQAACHPSSPWLLRAILCYGERLPSPALSCPAAAAAAAAAAADTCTTAVAICAAVRIATDVAAACSSGVGGTGPATVLNRLPPPKRHPAHPAAPRPCGRGALHHLNLQGRGARVCV
eukprot:826140-Pelagomonas_calceolata.AAC.3